MNWLKGFAIVTCLATPLSVVVATSASADSTVTSPEGGTTGKKSALTDDQKKAKSADCSKQADAKKLHGDERRKFRQNCKKA